MIKVKLPATLLGASWLRPGRFRAAHPRWWSVVTFLVLLLVFFMVGWRQIDPDFGWHLRSGIYIRAHGIPAHDIFTYTAHQFPWIDHEWGNDVILSLIYGWGGYAAAALLYGVIWAGALLLAGRRARLGILLVAALAVLPYAGIRPVAWTVLFLAVTFRVAASPRRWLVWLLPLLFIVWANVHAGFIIGLAVLLYLAVYERRPRLFGVFVLSALATLLNAYGPRLYEEVGRTLFDPTLHSQINEWTPFSLPTASVPFIVAWASGMFLFGARTVRSWLRPSVLLLIGSLSATRNVPLFVGGALAEVDRWFTRLLGAVPATLTAAGKRWARGLLIISALGLLYAAYVGLWPLVPGREADYPVAAVTYLRAHGCEGGQLFNDYDFGGYLIWQLPGRPVYVDGRMPSWKDPQGQKYMTRYYDLLANPQLSHREFARYDIRCSLLQKGPDNQGLIRLLQRDGWQTTVQRPGYVLQIAPRT